MLLFKCWIQFKLILSLTYSGFLDQLSLGNKDFQKWY